MNFGGCLQQVSVFLKFDQKEPKASFGLKWSNLPKIDCCYEQKPIYVKNTKISIMFVSFGCFGMSRVKMMIPLSEIA